MSSRHRSIIFYTDQSRNGKVKLTLNDSHITADEDILEHPEVLHKNYAWSNEKECRLVVRLSEEQNRKAIEQGSSMIRIKMTDASIHKMRNGRLIRSPVYQGGVDYGTPSALTGQVEWEL